MLLRSFILFQFSLLSSCAYLNTTLSTLAASKCNGADEVGLTLDYKYWRGDKTDFNKEGVLKGLAAFKRWLKQTPKEESFKYREGDIVGYMWVGSMIQNVGFADNIITMFEKEVKDNGFPSSAYLEYVNGDPFKGLGVAFQTGGKLSSVQRAVKLWSQGKKFETFTGSKQIKHAPVCYLNYNERKPIINDERAGECYYITMKENTNLEKETGVDSESLQGYNPDLDFDYVQLGEDVCYSVGTKP